MTEKLIQPLELEQKDIVRNALLDYVSVFMDIGAFDTSKRLLCEMPVCKALKNIGIPGYNVVEGVVHVSNFFSRSIASHYFLQDIDSHKILCPTAGQFFKEALPIKIPRGCRIMMLRKRAHYLFFPLDEENFYLYGEREEIREKLKLNYCTFGYI